jgi:alpha-N-arabinofuranosidase
MLLFTHHVVLYLSIHGCFGFGVQVTDGLGFYELLRLGEELGSELAMAVQDGQHSGAGRHYTSDADYPTLLEDAVDMLEFASGDDGGDGGGGNASVSRWSKLRAAMGHAAPFPMRRVEIGAEHIYA